MTSRSRTPISRVVVALIGNQKLRYFSSLLMWITIWTTPIIVGLLIAAFFDQLTGETAGWNLPTILAVLWAYLAARIGAVFIAMRLHSGLLFRAGAGMRGSMLAWIFSLPGARPVDETPGEIVSRFRDDVDHTLEALDFTVDFIGSTVSAIVAIIILLVEDMNARPFQKYHAVQALAANVALWVVIILLSCLLGALTFFIGGLCGMLPIFLWCVTLYWAYEAYQGKYFEIKWITNFLKDQNWL